METSPLERESKTVLDCGFHPLNPGFKALDSRFQSVVRFRIPWFVFRIPKPKIPESTNISRILDSTSKNFLDSRIQDCLGFWIPHPIFLIPDTGFYILCQWNWDSVQSLVGFWIPWAVFRILKPRIPDSTNQIFLIPDCTSKIFPDSQIRISLHRTKDMF